MRLAQAGVVLLVKSMKCELYPALVAVEHVNMIQIPVMNSTSYWNDNEEMLLERSFEFD